MLCPQISKRIGILYFIESKHKFQNISKNFFHPLFQEKSHFLHHSGAEEPIIQPTKVLLTPPFHWSAIPLRSWRSRIFSKIIPNGCRSQNCHTILGLTVSSKLPLRFYCASITLLLRSHYDIEDLAMLSLR